MKPLRIAYLSDMSPLDRNLYSGGNARIFDALKAHVGEVEILPQDWGAAEPVRRAIFAMPDRYNLRLRWRMHYALRGIIARRVSRVLAEGAFDVLFGAYALHTLAGVSVPKGVVTAFTSDAVQTVYRTSEIGQAHARVLPFGEVLDNWAEARERAVLQKLDVALWPSEWLCEAVDARYGLKSGVGSQIEWGANIAPPPQPEVKQVQVDRPLHLLVIGRDWFAKGGPVAFDTMMALRAQGVDARLSVIGCVPPEFHQNDHVTVLAELNKAVPEQLVRFEQALAEAHFLVQPSFESYGFAFCEASAYGLPSLCLRVGGVPIREGVNGHALPPGAGPEAFADLIREYLADPARYSALSASARQEYEARLNWPAWGARVRARLEAAVAARRASPGAPTGP